MPRMAAPSISLLVAVHAVVALLAEVDNIVAATFEGAHVATTITVLEVAVVAGLAGAGV